MDEVTLSTGAVAAVTALLGGLVAAIGMLFNSSRARERELTAELIAAKNEQIKREQDLVMREQELTEKLLPAVEEGNRTLARLVQLIETLQRDWISRTGPRE